MDLNTFGWAYAVQYIIMLSEIVRNNAKVSE